jgi:hypothetical protein
MTINQCHSTATFRRLCPPASASGTSSPGALQALGNLLRLRGILVSGAPEKQASGDAPHRDRGVELRSYAKEVVFHGGRAGPLRKGDTGRGVAQRLEFLLEGAVELRVHPGAAAHGAGLC